MATQRMTEVIDMVNSEAKRLGAFLGGLGQDSWAKDSICRGWAVADVVSHLSMGAKTWADNLKRAVAGDAEPLPGQGFLQPGERGSQVTADAAIAHSKQVGQQLLEEYNAGHQNLAKMLAGLKSEDWAKPCYHRRGNMPVSEYVARRVQELAVHGWDIRGALDPSAEMFTETLPEMVAAAARWLRNAFSPGQNLPTPVRFRFQVEAPVPVAYDILVEGDTFQTQDISGTGADVVIKCSTGNYILLVYGRLNAEKAVASGRLQVDNLEQTVNFTKWFQGF